MCPHAGREQRLVRVAEGRIRDQQAFLRVDPLAELLRAEFQQALARTRLNFQAGARRHVRRRLKLLGTLLACHRGIAVDNRVANETKQAIGAVASRTETEQFWGLFQEPGGNLASLEAGMVDDVLQELDIGLDATDPKFPQGPVSPGTSSGQSRVPCGELHQQRIVERAQDRAGIGRPVQANAQAGSCAISLQPPVVRRETIGRILGCNPALDRKAAPVDFILAGNIQRAFVQPASLCDQNLRAHDVNPRDGFGNGVLHLNPRIDLDEEPIS